MALMKDAMNFMDSARYKVLLRDEIDRIRIIWKERFYEQWKTMWPRLALSEHTTLSAQVEKPVPPGDPWAEKEMEIRAAIDERVDHILDTTADRWTEGVDPTYEDELLEIIRDDLETREPMISQVEALTMTAAAQAWAAASLGSHLFDKTWITQDDNLVRRTHADQHMMTIPYNSVFPNGLLYPGDLNGAPQEVINCRCVLFLTPKGEKADETQRDNGIDIQEMQFQLDSARRKIEEFLSRTETTDTAE